MNSRSVLFSLYSVVVLSLLTKIAFSVLVPPLFDEVYYVEWSRHLAWGYLDHPPGVAFLSAFGQNNSAFFAARSASIALCLLSIPLLVSSSRIIGLKSREQILLVLTLVFASFGGILYGAVTTPDVGMLFFWILATHESLAALQGKPNRWLTTGVAVGLGFLCKYLMLAFLPALFFALLTKRRQEFKIPKLWLGFGLSLLCMSPNLIWNAKNDWATFQFLTKRGLLQSYEKSSTEGLPEQLAQTSYEDAALASRLVDPLEIEKKRKRVPKSPVRKLFDRVSGFLGAVLGIWGLMFLPLLFTLTRRRQQAPPDEFNESQKRLLIYLVTIPLLFFGLVSTLTKIEANWFAMYVVSAALLIVSYFRLPQRNILVFGFLNILAMVALTYYSTSFRGPIKAKRLIEESKDFKELTENVATVAKYPLYAERYQIASQLNYYLKDTIVDQWPGLTRDSEFTRRGLLHPRVDNQFTIVGETFPPHSFEGFKLAQIFELRRCLEEGFQLREAVSKDLEPICRNKRLPNIYVSVYERRSS